MRKGFDHLGRPLGQAVQNNPYFNPYRQHDHQHADSSGQGGGAGQERTHGTGQTDHSGGAHPHYGYDAGVAGHTGDTSQHQYPQQGDTGQQQVPLASGYRHTEQRTMMTSDMMSSRFIPRSEHRGMHSSANQSLEARLRSLDPSQPDASGQSLSQEINTLWSGFRGADASTLQSERASLYQIGLKLNQKFIDHDNLIKRCTMPLDYVAAKQVGLNLNAEYHRFLQLDFSIRQKEQDMQYAYGKGGIPLERYKRKKDDKVRQILDEREFFHRTTLQGLANMLQEGQLKDIVDLGHSGAGDPNIKSRKDTNWKLFGQDFSPGQGPISGYASRHPWGYDAYVGGYGHVVIHFKKGELIRKDAVTVTLGDSHALSSQTRHQGQGLDRLDKMLGVVPTDVRSPDGRSVPLGWPTLLDSDFEARKFHGYVELQFHRTNQPLSTDLIENVNFMDPSVFNPGHPDKGWVDAARVQLERMRIPYNIAPPDVDYTYRASVLVPM